MERGITPKENFDVNNGNEKDMEKISYQTY